MPLSIIALIPASKILTKNNKMQLNMSPDLLSGKHLHFRTSLTVPQITYISKEKEEESG
jgi:hypothetical protein